MAIRSGLGAQLGLAAETTYGTYVAPTRTLEFTSEGLTVQRERIESSGLRKGSTVRRNARWADNRKGGGGPLAFELANKGFGLPLKHAMGAVTTTTPGGSTLARRHRFTLGDLDNLSLTIQKGIPEVETGTVRAYSFLGCVVTEWEMGVDVDGLVTFGMTVDAQEMDDAQTLAVAAFPANDELFSYQQTAITVDGGAVLPTALALNVGHGLNTGRYYVRNSPLKRRPVIADMRDVRGSLTLEFGTDVQVQRFLDAAPGAEVPIVVTVAGDLIDGTTNYGLTATMAKCRFDDGFPTVSGPDIITVTAPFVVLDDSTNPPLQVDYFTTDTAP